MKAAAITASAGVLLLGIGCAAHADETGFDRFDGAWTGGGTVRESAESKRLNVTCRLAGMHDGTHLKLAGSCRALLLFTRAIGADITYDPTAQTYSGVYTGASVGPARIVGKRRGDGVDFDVTWPKPIDGDDKAGMRITNPGNGEFSIEIFDAPAPGAAAVKTVSIKMRK